MLLPFHCEANSHFRGDLLTTFRASRCKQPLPLVRAARLPVASWFASRRCCTVRRGLRLPSVHLLFHPRRNTPPIMRAVYKPARAVGLAVLCLAATTKAHEHHMDNIPEGQYASSDPIVRYTAKLPRVGLLESHTDGPNRTLFYGYTFSFNPSPGACYTPRAWSWACVFLNPALSRLRSGSTHLPV